MTNQGPKSRTGQTIQEDDIIAVMIHTYRRGEITGSKVAVRGVVLKIYRESPRGQWRARIRWEDPVKGFLYTGKDNWAYIKEIELIRRVKK